MSGNLPTILSEINAIQGEMTTRAYWRDEEKQARYRDLVTQRQAVAGPVAGGEETGPRIAIASVSEYVSEHGTADGYSTYMNLARSAADVAINMPAADYAQFERSFEALPDDITAAALAELLTSKPSAEDVPETSARSFARTPAGAILAHEWGQNFRHNMGLVRARLYRIMDRFDESNDARFLGWLESLSTPAAVAIYRKLAA
ncbi:hypothetical protein [Sphingosinicella soli]|uniref:Uncharacterized protein n=1 Tax=Sphingosinicella soli TaxID=333708 RepID=A0A7W7F8I8_9SPHN|nr:hypothetical protein [Sphingosinicella soli]MBB4633769.1 hypothetical protein [Sphingosinicella soli]